MPRNSLLPMLALLALLAGCDSPSGPSRPVHVPDVGDELSFNVQFGDGLLCSAAARDERTGLVVAVTQRAVVVADVANPAGGYTDADYAALAHAFDTQIWLTVASHFGMPYDIDGNGRIVLFFTRAVNELSPAGQTWFVGGVFAARDLFPTRRAGGLDACAGSNAGELIYMPVPDPAGTINGHVRSRDAELRRAPGTLAHELQHVINGSRRLYGGYGSGADWHEELWLNEGLSQVAEEMMFYAATDLAPRGNIGIDQFIGFPARQNAFASYVLPNFQLLAHYLEDPDTTSLYGPDSRAVRGATWQFLRYAADRRGLPEPVFWMSLVSSAARGLANVSETVGGDALEWIHDWLVSVYAADHVAGTPPHFRQPSWNSRDLYPSLTTLDGFSYGRYPLRTRTLVNGSDVPLTLAAGSAAYLRFGVAAGAIGEVRASAGAAPCLTSGAAHALAVGAALTVAGEAAAAVCVSGGDAGADFVYIPFAAARTGSSELVVRGTGIIPTSDASPTGFVDGARAARPERAAAHDHGSARARAWEMRFREQERRELTPLVAGARVAADAPLAGGGSGADLRVTVLRTR